MFRVLRQFSLIVLCFALVAGSVSMAVARGQSAALSRGGTSLVICTGYGVMTITLDGQGNPVGPVYPCPKCLAGVAVYLPPGLPAIWPIALTHTQIIVRDPGVSPLAASVLIHRARGPPLMG